MRMRFLIVVLIFCITAFTAHAVSYSNDSDSVDIDYSGGSPVISEEGDDSELPPVPDEGEGGEESSPTEESSGNSSESSTTTFQEESPNVTIPIVIESEDGTSGSGATGEGSGEGGGITPEDVLNSLFGNQALFFGGGSGSTASESITISGTKARAALAARGIGKLTLSDLLGRRFLSKKDFTLVAASSVLENRAIEEVILTLDSLSLSYRAQGRLFAVFPLSYPVTVTVYPYAETREERIIVKFPWYKFFLQTFVSRAQLQREIDAVIAPIITDEVESIDAKTRLFVAVSDTISARFDTVEGTLRQ